jgi:hypothetical protein
MISEIYTHEVFIVFASHCLVTVLNSGESSALMLMPLQVGDRLKTNLLREGSLSQSYVTTDDQLISVSWHQTLSGARDEISVTVRQLLVC